MSFLSAIFVSRASHVTVKMEALQERDMARDKTERKRDLLALRSKDVQLKLRKYDRQRSRVSTKALGDQKLKGHIKKRAKQSEHAAVKAARAELLLLEEPGCADTHLHGLLWGWWRLHGAGCVCAQWPVASLVGAASLHLLSCSVQVLGARERDGEDV